MRIGKAVSWADASARLRSRKVTRQAVAAGLVAGFIAVAAGGVAVASAGGPAVLRGCYAVRTGALRLLTRPGQSCTPRERAVSWSEGSIDWRGSWHAGSSYAAGDAVGYAGSSYLATGASQGRVPALSPGVWSVLAASGQVGPPGPPGPSGPPGPAGPPGTGDYAEFYNQSAGNTAVFANSALPFSTAGPANGPIVAGDVVTSSWTFLVSGTFTVTVSVPFTGSGQYQLLRNDVPVSGTIAATPSITGGVVAETVVITASAGDQLAVGNLGDSSEVIAGTVNGTEPDATLLIQQIS